MTTQDLPAKCPADMLPGKNPAGRPRRHGAHTERIGVAERTRIAHKKKLQESAGECIVVGAGISVGGLSGRLLSRFAQSHFDSGRLDWANSGKAAALVIHYGTAWGTPGQLVGGTV
jgi:hypothetical protein